MRSTRHTGSTLLALALCLGVPSASRAIPEGPPGSTTGDGGAPLLGLSPSADAQMFTGAAVTSIPIEVPPGRNGVQPSLGLGYSHQAGSGALGAGWDVLIGRIERSVRFGVPRYDASDTFVVVLPDGAQELVPLAATSYGYRIDESHARITANTTANTWTLHDPSGRDYTFGATAAARVGPSPSGFGGTFAWHLTRIRDANGNLLDVDYLQRSGYAYPSAVHYGGHDSLPHRYHVEFTWDPRTGTGTAPRTSYAGGFAVVLDQTLRQVVVRYNATQIRRYEFLWGPSTTNAGPLLTEVRLYGKNEQLLAEPDGTTAVSPKFTYYQTPALPFAQPRAESVGISSFRDADVCNSRDFLDIDGDGRPDLVQTGVWSDSNRVWHVRRNLGPGSATLFASTSIAWPAPNPCIVRRYDQLNPHRTTRATVDMNGDARPDYIDTQQKPGSFCGGSLYCPWLVYLNTGQGFNATPIEWETPTQIQLHGHPIRGSDADEVPGGLQPNGKVGNDLVDVDGDGKPEFVNAWNWQDTPTGRKWRVHWNTGSGFQDWVDIPAPLHWIRNGGPDTGDRNVKTDLFDLNGDGIPDKVAAQGNNDGTGHHWDIWYGTGTGFAGPFRWTSPALNFLRSWDQDLHEYVYDLLDVNGDGLPDFVDARQWSPSSPYWKVWRNTGTMLAPEQQWAAPGRLRKRAPGATDGALVTDTFDIDGNGYPDSIRLTGTTATISLGHPEPSRPDALATITTNSASRTTLTYAVTTQFNDGTTFDPALQADGVPHLPFPVWVVRSIATADLVFGADVSRTFTYEGGFFDPGRREFRGFRVATVTDAHGNAEVTRFLQTDALRGKIEYQALFARHPLPGPPAGKLRETGSAWTVQTAGARAFPRLTSIVRNDFSSNQSVPWNETSAKTTISAYEHDACGNLTRERVFDGFAQLIENTAAFTPIGGSCTADRVCSGICDKPSQTGVTGGVAKRLAYDSKGNLKTSQLVGEGDPTTSMDYDPYGNVTGVTEPLGARTDIAYDADKLRPATVTRDAGGLAHVTETDYDSLFGKLTRRREPSGSTTRFEYDDFGRLAKEAEPGQELSQATREYAYTLGGLSRVDILHLELHPTPHRLTESTFYDGLGRRLQRQTRRIVRGQWRTIASDAVVRAVGGRVTQEFAPIVVAQDDPRVRVPVTSQPATVPSYDEFGRVLARVLPDGNITSTTRKTARVARSCDPLNNAASSAGGCTEEEVDALGRVIAKRTYHGQSTSWHTLEELTHDPGGRGVVRTRLNGDSRTDVVTTYDALGRRRSLSDPNSGLWRFGYDANGNLVYHDDPKTGRHIELQYDRLNRLTRRVLRAGGDDRGTGTPTTELASYAFHTTGNGRGRVASVTDPSGETRYLDYDARGNPLRVFKRISFLVGSTTEVKQFETVSSYDTLGRLLTATYPYPDADGIEQISWSYGEDGAPIRTGSDLHDYVREQQYDELGHVTLRTYGNGVQDRFGYLGPTAQYRLHDIVTQRPGVPTPLRELEYYDYDPNGNIRGIRDLLNPPRRPQNLTVTATYDDDARLASATQCGGGGYSGTFVHDRLGNLAGKDGQPYDYGGPGPHRPTSVGGGAVTYDENGSMRFLPDGRELIYDVEGRLIEVRRNTATVARYAYDATGQRVASHAAGATTFYFGSFDLRLETGRAARHVSIGGRIVATSVLSAGSLLATGPRADVGRTQLARTTGTGLLVLLGAALLVPGRRPLGKLGRVRRGTILALSVVTVSAQLALPRPATAQCPVAKAPPAGTLFYHTDHVGTVQLVTGATGAVVEQAVLRPYGTSGGTFDAGGQPAGDPQSPFQFTGHRTDDGTGLVYFGARYYDPGLGMFVTHDPAGELLSPYNHTNGNPLNLTDPDGRDIIGFIIGVIVSAIIGAILSVVVTAFLPNVTGGQLAQAAIFGAIGGALLGPGGIVTPIIEASATLSLAYNLALAGYAAYNAARAFEDGRYTSGSVAIVGAALALVGAGGAVSRLARQAQTLQANALGGERYASGYGGVSLSDAQGLAMDPPVQEDPVGDALIQAGFGTISSGVRALVGAGRALGLRIQAAAAQIDSALLTKGTRLFHYTDEASAVLIEKTQLGLPGRSLYLSPKGNLSPVQAQIELALPQTNTGTAVFEVAADVLDPAAISGVGRVTGNVFGRGGGGLETVYDGTIPREAFRRIR